MNSTRAERWKTKKHAIHDAIKVLRGDGGYEYLDCGILNLKRFPEEVRDYLVEAVAEVQDEWLSRIAEAAVGYLEDKLERLERQG